MRTEMGTTLRVIGFIVAACGAASFLIVANIPHDYVVSISICIIVFFTGVVLFAVGTYLRDKKKNEERRAGTRREPGGIGDGIGR
jgi:hypothetical protein